ncbi:MAG: zinc-binding dehydrogenase, partial [Armatimonadetes bacterium]|nr:zinc-binding dehydrogenase [Anaerolineae bacterium]
MLQGPLVSMTSSQKFGNMMAKPSISDLVAMTALLEAGKLAPVIDRTYPLSAVTEAFRYFDAGHAQGKVVITVAP